MDNTTPPHRPPAADPFVRKGLSFPYVWISALLFAALCVVGFVAVKAIRHGGLMPTPSVLARYVCPTPAAPLTIFFRHGDAQVQLETASGHRQGMVVNGKITWSDAPLGAAPAGLALPTEITYDDTQSIRIGGPGYPVVRCAKAPLVSAGG